MSSSGQQEQFTFQAEIKRLLHLLSHSLYQNREIAIRELVSNASDALDKMRHISLTADAHKDDVPLEIQLVPNKEQRILEITDNGIGMTHDELVQNLGTIAHSGSLEYLSKLSQEQKPDVSLIGQFGVGFYSAFMLADQVEVLTRSYQSDESWCWTSDGAGSFTIESVEPRGRGTTIRLHLKEDLDEFTDPVRLKHVLKRYSTFVPHPIKLEGEHVNDQRPIWVEPRSSLTEEQYDSFYQYLTHHSDEKPLWYLHLSADSPFQFHSILYCPPMNLEAMGFGRTEHGLHLCAKRILVQNDCRELLPDYLRFIYGLVDSADLPLNVSRESLQDNTVFRKMKKVIVRKVLDHLSSLADDEPDKYLDFYRLFGSTLREGAANDFEHRDRIARLLRFESSAVSAEDGMTSLAAYVERAPEDQQQIYYVGGIDKTTIERNPGLEIFRKRGVEVLYLTDPIDEVVLSTLGKFDDKTLLAIDAAEVELPESTAAPDESPDEETSNEPPSGFETLLTLFREALGDRVEEVRKSDRLIDSPCCLVNPKGAMSTQMQKIMQMSDREFEFSKRIFEVNPKAALIKRLAALTANADQVPFIKQCGRQLFANAQLQAGLLPDMDEMITRVQEFMEDLSNKRSPIIT